MRNAITLVCTAAVSAALGLAIGGCSDLSTGTTGTQTSFAWPAALAPFGNGYPRTGDVCRRLAESDATSAYLDHKATLVGCPGAADGANAQAIVHGLRGRVVGETEGVTLISVPNVRD